MAEEVRFELTELLHSAVFKTAALNHSATLPKVRSSSIAYTFLFFNCNEDPVADFIGLTFKFSVHKEWCECFHTIRPGRSY